MGGDADLSNLFNSGTVTYGLMVNPSGGLGNGWSTWHSGGVAPTYSVVTPTVADGLAVNWQQISNPAAANQNATGGGGYLYVVAVPIRAATTITNIILNVANAGSGLTAGQNFAGLYQGGSLLAPTANQTTAWASAGLQVMALTFPPGGYPRLRLCRVLRQWNHQTRLQHRQLHAD